MPLRFQPDQRNLSTRPLRMESLERRIVLSSDVGVAPIVAPPVVDTASTDSVEAAFVLDAIVVRVNETEQVLRNNDLLQLTSGDVLEIVRIDYATTQQLDGVLAAEGYIHKLPLDGHAAGTFDYGDGRFGGGETLALGTGVHAGLEGSWVVDEGWDRLAVSVVRYFGNESNTEGAIHVRMQVGQPDFQIYESFANAVRDMKFEVGNPVDFRGMWENSGAGRFHNYMEIDVVRVGDQDVYEWVGVLAGNASQGTSVDGTIDNHNPEDAFATVWTPTTAGEYRIIMAVDPEKLWNESDETNNYLRLSVKVDKPQPTPERTLVFSASFEDHKLKDGKVKYVKSTDGFKVRGKDRAELQRNVKNIGAASDGDVLLELDSTKNSSVYRSFDSQPGERFAMELDYSPRPGVSGDSNIIEVLFNGRVVATLARDGRGLKHTDFKMVAMDLPSANGKKSVLELRAAGKSDRLGGLIDNVRLYSFGVPIYNPTLPSILDPGQDAETEEAQPLSAEDQACFLRDAKAHLIDGVRGHLPTKAVEQILPKLDDLEFTKLCEIVEQVGLDVDQQLRDFDVATAFRSKHDWWSSGNGDKRWWDTFFKR